MPSLGALVVLLLLATLVYVFYRAYRVLRFFDEIHLDFLSLHSRGDTDYMRQQIGRAVVEKVHLFNQRAQFLLLRARPENVQVPRLKQEFAEMQAYSTFNDTPPNRSLSLRIVTLRGSWRAKELFERVADQRLWTALGKEMVAFSELVNDSFGIAMHLKTGRSP